MPSSGVVCNLNAALLSFGFGNSVKSLLREPRFLFRHSQFSCEAHFPRRGFASSESTVDIAQKYSHCRNTMASASAAGELVVDKLILRCGNVTSFVKPIGVFCNERVGCRNFQNLSMRLGSREPYNNRRLVQGYFIFDVTQRCFSSNSDFDPSLKNAHASSSSCYSDGLVPDMTVNGLSCSEELATTTVSADQCRHDLAEKNLKLLSGSCYLPHPDKKETGGEDAHFICVNEQVIGVADGVGGWADVGVNAGLYARELMSNSVGAILNEPKDSIDPARVLTRAHSATKAMGSSTACIICLKEEGIHAINLGDSGFIVVRDGCSVFESPVQQHGFNFTYQLECSSRSDQPSSGQVFMIPVVPGDVIVAGTDGLFDNLFNDEVISIVADGLREGLNPNALSQKLAASAQQRALNRHKQTPFSTAAKEAGFRYYGGKPDDITVVVSYISSSTN
ncbi:Protein phosphatase [Heracleum sosnowskyi]|uniref:Protein phosphatase n=1 Tax=Heracleum sosnowskyi TaxID=360622 RepID=A0AAD8M3Z2_9APIA|nr:Protein phosphatase [Heracleum sosnowskyi]